MRSLIEASGSRTNLFDQEYGTDTELIVSVGALDIPDGALEHSNRYEAVVPEAFFAIMGQLPLPHQDFVFVDIGCGKGRALLLASRFPFKKIIGVDISENLIEVAARNIEIFKGKQKCEDIQVICKDATSYEIPKEKLLIYLNNPFDEHLMRVMVDNCEESIRIAPRKIYVVYQRPVHRSLWDTSSSFRLVRSAARYVLYESWGYA